MIGDRDAMADPGGRFLVGIDTGGTFTDLVAYDLHSGTLSTSKTPSVPSEPGQALLDAVQAADLAMSEIAGLVHGTTVATNVSTARHFTTYAGRNRNRSWPRDVTVSACRSGSARKDKSSGRWTSMRSSRSVESCGAAPSRR
jgi:hypothetical protein